MGASSIGGCGHRTAACRIAALTRRPIASRVLLLQPDALSFVTDVRVVHRWWGILVGIELDRAAGTRVMGHYCSFYDGLQ
mmetsp:Transcript_18362/g.50995  ORF Transcript_18362/g.50995 Transcript_18362/m.50995 type:complete len:80 (+) Transcript_18362:857-1096(+)